MIAIPCASCGKEIKRSYSQGHTPKMAFCGVQCRRTRDLRHCLFCGSQFEITPSQINRGRGAFCSRDCAGNARKRPVVNQICKGCGVTFTTSQKTLTGNPFRTHCSRQCYFGTVAKRMSGRPKTPEHRAALSNSKIGKPAVARRRFYIFTCEQCGCSVEKTGNLHRTAARFCGTACWYVFIRAHPEQHPTFRGGREPYYGPNWREQARHARARDGHTCCHCGHHQTRPLLDVHHIRPRREFDGDYIAANQLSNLITLCKSCHSKQPS